MKHIDKIQAILPLGYLYLVVLGILKETVFFYQIGINILNYSSIMDILISPIATCLSNPLIFIAVISFFVFCYYLPTILYNYGHKSWIKKTFELKKNKNDLPDEEIKSYYNLVSFKFLAVGLLSFYLGIGLAEGYFTSNRIQNNKLHYDYRLYYNTGESEIVSVLESNSVYYFYVSKGEKTVKIAPIGGIRNIELIKNRMLDETK